MGRPLVAQDDVPALFLLPVDLAFRKQPYAVCQNGDLLFLTGDNVRYFLNCAGQVGDLFLKLCDLCHRLPFAGCLSWVQPFAKA